MSTSIGTSLLNRMFIPKDDNPLNINISDQLQQLSITLPLHQQYLQQHPTLPQKTKLPLPLPLLHTTPIKCRKDNDNVSSSTATSQNENTTKQNFVKLPQRRSSLKMIASIHAQSMSMGAHHEYAHAGVFINHNVGAVNGITPYDRRVRWGSPLEEHRSIPARDEIFTSQPPIQSLIATIENNLPSTSHPQPSTIPEHAAAPHSIRGVLHPLLDKTAAFLSPPSPPPSPPIIIPLEIPPSTPFSTEYRKYTPPMAFTSRKRASIPYPSDEIIQNNLRHLYKARIEELRAVAKTNKPVMEIGDTDSIPGISTALPDSLCSRPALQMEKGITEPECGRDHRSSNLPPRFNSSIKARGIGRRVSPTIPPQEQPAQSSVAEPVTSSLPATSSASVPRRTSPPAASPLPTPQNIVALAASPQLVQNAVQLLASSPHATYPPSLPQPTTQIVSAPLQPAQSRVAPIALPSHAAPPLQPSYQSAPTFITSSYAASTQAVPPAVNQPSHSLIDNTIPLSYLQWPSLQPCAAPTPPLQSTINPITSPTFSTWPLSLPQASPFPDPLQSVAAQTISEPIQTVTTQVVPLYIIYAPPLPPPPPLSFLPLDQPVQSRVTEDASSSSYIATPLPVTPTAPPHSPSTMAYTVKVNQNWRQAKQYLTRKRSRPSHADSDKQVTQRPSKMAKHAHESDGHGSKLRAIRSAPLSASTSCPMNVLDRRQNGARNQVDTSQQQLHLRAPVAESPVEWHRKNVVRAESEESSGISVYSGDDLFRSDVESPSPSRASSPATSISSTLLSPTIQDHVPAALQNARIELNGQATSNKRSGRSVAHHKPIRPLLKKAQVIEWANRLRTMQYLRSCEKVGKEQQHQAERMLDFMISYKDDPLITGKLLSETELGVRMRPFKHRTEYGDQVKIKVRELYQYWHDRFCVEEA